MKWLIVDRLTEASLFDVFVKSQRLILLYSHLSSTNYKLQEPKGFELKSTQMHERHSLENRNII